MVQLKIVSFQIKVADWPLKMAVQQINALKDQLKNIVPKKLVSLFSCLAIPKLKSIL